LPFNDCRAIFKYNTKTFETKTRHENIKGAGNNCQCPVAFVRGWKIEERAVRFENYFFNTRRRTCHTSPAGKTEKYTPSVIFSCCAKSCVRKQNQHAGKPKQFSWA